MKKGQESIRLRIFGLWSGVELHLPFPNRNVKRPSAHNTCPETDREDRSRPRIVSLNFLW